MINRKRKSRNPHSFVADYKFPALKKRILKNINALQFQINDLVDRIEYDIDFVAGKSEEELSRFSDKKLKYLKNNLEILDRIDQELPKSLDRLKAVE